MKPDTIGWLLFTASAAAFTVSSLKSGDPAALLGSLLFLIACGVFMWPQAGALLGRKSRAEGERKRRGLRSAPATR